MGIEHEKAWFTRPQMLDLFDVGQDTFKKSIQPLLPAKFVRKDERGRYWFYGRGVLNAWATNQKGETTPDPELAGEASTGLERYREARAALAELELQIKRGDLLLRSDVHEGLSEAGSILRRKAVRLRKLFGEPAAQIIADAVDDMLRANERLFGGETNP